MWVSHFHGEDGNVLFVFDGGVSGRGEQEAGFAHSRPSGDNEEVGGLQPA